MASLWLTLVITCVIFGYAGNLYAKKTGRDPLRWTILGIILNIAVLAAMFVAGSRSEKVRRYTN